MGILNYKKHYSGYPYEVVPRNKINYENEVKVPTTIETPKAVEKQVPPEQPQTPSVEDKKRREIIKKFAVGTAAITGCSVLPEKWAAPLLEFGSLPAHAATSGAIETLVDSVEEAVNQDDSGWTRIEWGGDPADNGAAMRDVSWWTKIHGPEWPHWHRKFPLPKWLDDSPNRVEFQFSDGVTFYVPDSTKMFMDMNGPKYTPELPGEPDPKRKHPKIGALLGTSPTWVQFRIV